MSDDLLILNSAVSYPPPTQEQMERMRAAVEDLRNWNFKVSRVSSYGIIDETGKDLIRIGYGMNSPSIGGGDSRLLLRENEIKLEMIISRRHCDNKKESIVGGSVVFGRSVYNTEPTQFKDTSYGIVNVTRKDGVTTSTYREISLPEDEK
jgi:hypothetical protein